MSSRSIIRAVALGLSLAVLAASASARAQAPAQETDTQRAERLFVEASSLMDSHQYVEACPKFAASQRIDPGVGTQFNLAVCFEKIGRLGSAWRNYGEVERFAHAAGKTAREDAAREKLGALRPRVPHLIVASADADATVSVDGEVATRDSWGFYAVDAGAHTIEATAPAKKPWRVEIAVGETDAAGAGAVVRVTVPRLQAAVGETRIVTVDTSNTKRTVGLVALGLGVVGVGAAALTGVIILNRKETADRNCAPTCTDQDGRDAVASLKTLLPLNMVAWGVGVVGLSVGAYLVLTSPSKPSPQPAPALAVSFDPHGASGTLRVRF